MIPRHGRGQGLSNWREARAVYGLAADRVLGGCHLAGDDIGLWGHHGGHCGQQQCNDGTIKHYPEGVEQREEDEVRGDAAVDTERHLHNGKPERAVLDASFLVPFVIGVGQCMGLCTWGCCTFTYQSHSAPRTRFQACQASYEVAKDEAHKGHGEGNDPNAPVGKEEVALSDRAVHNGNCNEGETSQAAKRRNSFSPHKALVPNVHADGYGQHQQEE